MYSKLRRVAHKDVDEIKKIYNRYYQHNAFPDFHNVNCISFLVVDDSDNVISVMGINPILEIVAVTNKDYPSTTKVRALGELLKQVMSTGFELGYNELHAFAHDTKWTSQLIRSGFKLTDNKVLTLDL